MRVLLFKILFLFVVSFANGQILIVNSAETDLNYSQANDSAALDINSKVDGIFIPVLLLKNVKNLHRLTVIGKLGKACWYMILI